MHARAHYTCTTQVYYSSARTCASTGTRVRRCHIKPFCIDTSDLAYEMGMHLRSNCYACMHDLTLRVHHELETCLKSSYGCTYMNVLALEYVHVYEYVYVREHSIYMLLVSLHVYVMSVQHSVVMHTH